MEHETIISTTRQAPTDVGVMALRDGFLAAWSADGATGYALLDARGRAVSGIHQIQLAGRSPHVAPDVRDGTAKTFWPPAARTSVAAEDLQLVRLGEDRAVLLMLSLPGPGGMGGAFGAVVDLKTPGPVRAIRLGPAGEYATRITGVAVGDDLIVVWHDGGLSSSKLRFARLAAGTLEVKARKVMEGAGVAASPVLARSAGRTVLAWSETERSDTRLRSYVKTARVSPSLALTSEATVVESRFLYPSPDMAVMGERLGLTFRDDADRDDTPEYHFALLSPDGASVIARQRISQADGYRGPSLISVDGAFLGAAIRSFQRNLLIGINRFDPLGTKLGGEFQVYADNTDFVRVDVSQNAENLLMVYAEDRDSNGRILAGQVMCTKER